METCEFQMGSENDNFFSALHKNSAIASNYVNNYYILLIRQCWMSEKCDKHLTSIDI